MDVWWSNMFSSKDLESSNLICVFLYIYNGLLDIYINGRVSLGLVQLEGKTASIPQEIFEKNPSKRFTFPIPSMELVYFTFHQ